MKRWIAEQHPSCRNPPFSLELDEFVERDERAGQQFREQGEVEGDDAQARAPFRGGAAPDIDQAGDGRKQEKGDAQGQVDRLEPERRDGEESRDGVEIGGQKIAVLEIGEHEDQQRQRQGKISPAAFPPTGLDA